MNFKGRGMKIWWPNLFGRTEENHYPLSG